MTNFPTYLSADAELLELELLQHVFILTSLALTPRPSSDSVFPRFKTLSYGVHRLKKMENSCLPAGFPSIPFAIGRISGLTGLTLHTSPSGRKQWQKADRSAAARSLWSRFLHLIQEPMNKVLSWCVCTHTHIDVAAQESAFKTSLVTRSTFLKHYVQRLMGVGRVLCKWFRSTTD